MTGAVQAFTIGDRVPDLGIILDISNASGSWEVKTDGGTLLGSSNAGSVEQQSTATFGNFEPENITPTLPGNSNKFRAIVMQVQTALFTYGYYGGMIDGLVGPQTRASLTKLQSDYGLKVTGTITPQTLDALRIVAE